MKEYYREKLANLREIFRGLLIIIIGIASGLISIFIKITHKFDIILLIFSLIGFFALIGSFFMLQIVWKNLNDITEKLKDRSEN